MSNTGLCVCFLAVLLLLIRLENKIRRLEKTFGEILSGEMLRGIVDSMREKVKQTHLNDGIKPVSEETIKKLDIMVKSMSEQEKRLTEQLKKKICEDENPNSQEGD